MVGCIAPGSIRVAAMFLVITDVTFNNFARLLQASVAKAVTVERDKTPVRFDIQMFLNIEYIFNDKICRISSNQLTNELLTYINLCHV